MMERSETIQLLEELLRDSKRELRVSWSNQGMGWDVKIGPVQFVHWSNEGLIGALRALMISAASERVS